MFVRVPIKIFIYTQKTIHSCTRRTESYAKTVRVYLMMMLLMLLLLLLLLLLLMMMIVSHLCSGRGLPLFPFSTSQITKEWCNLISDLRIVKTEYFRSCCTDTPASCFCCSHFPLLLDRSFRRNFTTIQTIPIATIFRRYFSEQSLKIEYFEQLLLQPHVFAQTIVLVFSVLFLSICDSKEMSSPCVQRFILIDLRQQRKELSAEDRRSAHVSMMIFRSATATFIDF